MTQNELVRYLVADGVAHIELNRPQASNAFDVPTANAFARAVEQASLDARARSLMLTGSGKRFCAGGDIDSFVAAEDRAAYLEELALVLDSALQSLGSLEKPAVAAVHGAVAGAGLALMLSCDLIVAESSTKFVTAYAGIGLTPDCGLSYLLPRAVGQQRALDLLLSGRILTAHEARDWGMVTEVQGPEHYRDRAERVAQSLAAGPVFALGQAKRLVRMSWASSRAEVGREEAQVIARAVAQPDATRLIDTFLDR